MILLNLAAESTVPSQTPSSSTCNNAWLCNIDHSKSYEHDYEASNAPVVLVQSCSSYEKPKSVLPYEPHRCFNTTSINRVLEISLHEETHGFTHDTFRNVRDVYCHVSTRFETTPRFFQSWKQPSSHPRLEVSL